MLALSELLYDDLLLFAEIPSGDPHGLQRLILANSLLAFFSDDLQPPFMEGADVPLSVKWPRLAGCG